MEIGGGGAFTYVFSFPRVPKTARCPVIGCPAVVHSVDRLRGNFMYRHCFSQILVVQEVKETLPCCDLCGIHMPVG